MGSDLSIYCRADLMSGVEALSGIGLISKRYQQNCMLSGEARCSVNRSLIQLNQKNLDYIHQKEMNRISNRSSFYKRTGRNLINTLNNYNSETDSISSDGESEPKSSGIMITPNKLVKEVSTVEILSTNYCSAIDGNTTVTPTCTEIDRHNPYKRAGSLSNHLNPSTDLWRDIWRALRHMGWSWNFRDGHAGAGDVYWLPNYSKSSPHVLHKVHYFYDQHEVRKYLLEENYTVYASYALHIAGDKSIPVDVDFWIRLSGDCKVNTARGNYLNTDDLPHQNSYCSLIIPFTFYPDSTLNVYWLFNAHLFSKSLPSCEWLLLENFQSISSKCADYSTFLRENFKKVKSLQIFKVHCLNIKQYIDIEAFRQSYFYSRIGQQWHDIPMSCKNGTEKLQKVSCCLADKCSYGLGDKLEDCVDSCESGSFDVEYDVESEYETDNQNCESCRDESIDSQYSSEVESTLTGQLSFNDESEVFEDFGGKEEEEFISDCNCGRADCSYCDRGDSADPMRVVNDRHEEWGYDGGGGDENDDFGGEEVAGSVRSDSLSTLSIHTVESTNGCIDFDLMRSEVHDVVSELLSAVKGFSRRSALLASGLYLKFLYAFSASQKRDERGFAKYVNWGKVLNAFYTTLLDDGEQSFELYRDEVRVEQNWRKDRKFAFISTNEKNIVTKFLAENKLKATQDVQNVRRILHDVVTYLSNHNCTDTIVRSTLRPTCANSTEYDFLFNELVDVISVKLPSHLRPYYLEDLLECTHPDAKLWHRDNTKAPVCVQKLIVEEAPIIDSMVLDPVIHEVVRQVTAKKVIGEKRKRRKMSKKSTKKLSESSESEQENVVADPIDGSNVFSRTVPLNDLELTKISENERWLFAMKRNGIVEESDLCPRVSPLSVNVGLGGRIRKKVTKADSTEMLNIGPRLSNLRHELCKKTMKKESLMFDCHRCLQDEHKIGDSKKAIFLTQRWVSFTFRECLCSAVLSRPGNNRVTVEEMLNFIYYELNDTADKITLFADTFTKLTNNEGPKQDGKRLAASVVIKGEHFDGVRNILQNILYLLRNSDIIYRKAFACAGTGEEDSITLLMSLVGCARQVPHTDYDHRLFNAVANWKSLPHGTYKESYKFYNGASMFVNFSACDVQSIDLTRSDGNSNYDSIPLPVMSFMVMRGDVFHAGSANTTDAIVRKFFQYLDPYPNERRKSFLKYKDSHIYLDAFPIDDYPKFNHRLRELTDKETASLRQNVLQRTDINPVHPKLQIR